MSSNRSKTLAARPVDPNVRETLLAHAKRLLADLALTRPHHEVEQGLDEAVPWFALSEEGGDSVCFTFWPTHFAASNFAGQVLMSASWADYEPGQVLQWFAKHVPQDAQAPRTAH